MLKAIEGAEYKAYQMLELYEYAAGDTDYVYVVTPEWTEFFVNESSTDPDNLAADTVKDYFVVEKFDDKYFVSWKDVAGETDAAKQVRLETFAGSVEEFIETKGNSLIAKGTAKGEKNIADNTVSAVINDLPFGYYFINTNGGSAVVIDTFVPNATVEEKNSAPTLEKKVRNDRDATATDEASKWQDNNTASIGDIVTFKTTITVGTGAINYVLHDAMSDGLTFKEVSKVELYKNISTDADTLEYRDTPTLELTKSADGVTDYHYEVKTTSVCAGTIKATPEAATPETCDFEVVFAEKIFAKDGFNASGTSYTITEGDRLVVTYTATLNADAVVADPGNPNRTILTYGDTPAADSEPLKTPPDETTTYTYKFDLVKTNKKNEVLPDAEFMLHDSSVAEADRKADNAIKLVEIKTGDVVTGYRVATTEDTSTVTTIIAGKPTIKGLGNGTYYLTETKAPDGYKALTAPVEFTIASANRDATITQANDGKDNTVDKLTEGTGVQVINVKKSIFPHTGGMGTTVYYLAGGAIVALVAALAVMSFKKRQSSKA